jgi:sec-independent protein translocase protein TatB
MFNLGISEMAMIAALALLLIGPKQLPEVARMVGRFLNDLRHTTNSFTSELRDQVRIDQQKIFDLRSEQEKQQNASNHNQAMQAQQQNSNPPAAEVSPVKDDKKS